MLAHRQTSTSVFGPRGSHAACACSTRLGSSTKPLSRVISCRAWDYEETRWQPLHDVQQPFSEASSAVAEQGPSATLRRVLDVVREGDLDGMLEFCPDEVIDKLLALRKETG